MPRGEDLNSILPRTLLSHSTKTEKGLKQGVGTAVMYLSPADLSGKNVCPMSTAGCRAACLHDAGMLKFAKSQQAQQKRTAWFHADRLSFRVRLGQEINVHAKACERNGLVPAVRLNGTSDLRWERIYPDLFETYPDVRFYDYTKIPNRRDLPSNYTLTFSLAESSRSWSDHVTALDLYNVAVVLRGCGTSRHPLPFPETWNGRPLIDGDMSDVRFLDDPRSGAYVGLRPKGRALRDDSGFVRDVFAKVAA